MRDYPTGRWRALILTAFLCGTMVIPIAAQQSLDQPGTTGIGTGPAMAPSPSAVAPGVPDAGAAQLGTPEANTAQAGPRVATRFESYESRMPGAREEAKVNASGGQHTIVLSTLALVLVVVIIVLLAVN